MTTPTNADGSKPADAAQVAEPRQKADAEVINDMLRGAVNDAESAGVFDKLALAYNTRRMLWEGQTDTGLLPAMKKLPKDRKVFTWEGAPDTGVPYADEVVTENVLLRKAAWHRGEIRLGPRELNNSDGVKDEELAEGWQSAMNFWVTTERRRMGYQLGLFSTCVEECGYGLMYTGARRAARMAKLTVTLDQVLAKVVEKATLQVVGLLSTQPPMDTQPPENAAAALTPEMLARIQQAAQEGLDAMLLDNGSPQLAELLLEMDPAMPRTEARYAARELRRTGRSATYYAPQDDGYEPCLEALVPFINVIHGTDLTGDGRGWWFAIPRRFCEADLRVRAAAEGWNDDFLNAVLMKGNQFMVADQSWSSRVPRWALSGAGVEQVTEATDTEFYEVVYVWRQMPNKDGLPMVYHTLVHPAVNDLVGFHECSGMAELPLHTETREEVLFAVQSRGIPEIAVKAGMPTMKVLMDAEGARAQLASNPPLERGIDVKDFVEPGMLLFRKRGAEPSQFMQVPQADQGSLNMLDRVRDQLDKRFFRHKETDPDIKRIYREAVALSSAESIREVVRLLWKVMQGHVDVVKVGRIAGKPVNLTLSRDSMQGDVDVDVEFNVDGLSMDAQTRMIDWGTKLLQLGADNVDVNELVNVFARMSNPGMARRIIMNRDAAAKRIVDDQNNRIAQMSAGVPMQYDERATAPDLRLNVMQSWMQRPENILKAQQDPVWGASMQDELTYLQRQKQQYQENAVTGRTLMKTAA